MIRNLNKTLGLLVALAMLLSITGVFATWQFTEPRVDPVYVDFKMQMYMYNWEGSEELPDNTGEDHHWLIENLVYGEGIGLSTPKSELNDLINERLDGGVGWKRDYFGSMAMTGGDEMEELFGTKAEGLSFLIHVISTYEYHIYTTNVYLGERGSSVLGINTKKGNPATPIGEYISPIYKTVITRESTVAQWEIISSKEGKAKSDWYDENRRNANATEIPAFDPTTWVEN